MPRYAAAIYARRLDHGKAEMEFKPAVIEASSKAEAEGFAMRRACETWPNWEVHKVSVVEILGATAASP